MVEENISEEKALLMKLNSVESLPSVGLQHFKEPPAFRGKCDNGKKPMVGFVFETKEEAIKIIGLFGNGTKSRILNGSEILDYINKQKAKNEENLAKIESLAQDAMRVEGYESAIKEVAGLFKTLNINSPTIAKDLALVQDKLRILAGEPEVSMKTCTHLHIKTNECEGCNDFPEPCRPA